MRGRNRSELTLVSRAGRRVFARLRWASLVVLATFGRRVAGARAVSGRHSSQRLPSPQVITASAATDWPFTPARMAGPEVRHCHPDVARQGEVAGRLGAERVLPGLPGRLRRLRRWPAVPPWRAGQDPSAPAVGRQIPDRPGHAGISAIAATRSAGGRGIRMRPGLRFSCGDLSQSV